MASNYDLQQTGEQVQQYLNSVPEMTERTKDTTVININAMADSEGTYTLETAIAALGAYEEENNVTYRKSGLVLTYKTYPEIWESKQFLGDVEDFDDESLWTDFGSSYVDVEVDDELDAESENPIQNKAVAAAIERLNAEVFPFKITLNGGGSTYELGSSQTVNLSWQYTDNEIGSQKVNGVVVPNGTYQKQFTNVSSNTTYRLQVVYKGANYEKSTSVSFKLRKYWGTSAKTSLESSDIIAMSKEFASDYKLDEKTLNCQGGKYIYFIVPASLAPVSLPDFRVGGFANSNWEETTQTVTNASGNSSSYKIYRLRDIQTGDSITLQVK